MTVICLYCTSLYTVFYNVNLIIWLEQTYPLSDRFRGSITRTLWGCCGCCWDCWDCCDGCWPSTLNVALAFWALSECATGFSCLSPESCSAPIRSCRFLLVSWSSSYGCTCNSFKRFRRSWRRSSISFIRCISGSRSFCSFKKEN